MNKFISRLLAGIAALLMLGSVGACKQYPTRLDFTGSSSHYRWPTIFGEIYINGKLVPYLGNESSSGPFPKSVDKELFAIKAAWVEFHSGRSFEATFDVPIRLLTRMPYSPDVVRIKLQAGRHGEMTIIGPMQNHRYEEVEVLKLCGRRTPNNDASFTDWTSYLAENTNFNDPKRLELPLPESSCPDPKH